MDPPPPPPPLLLDEDDDDEVVTVVEVAGVVVVVLSVLAGLAAGATPAERASVVTDPEDVIFRSAALPVSATNRFPEASITTLLG